MNFPILVQMMLYKVFQIVQQKKMISVTSFLSTQNGKNTFGPYVCQKIINQINTKLYNCDKVNEREVF